MCKSIAKGSKILEKGVRSDTCIRAINGAAVPVWKYRHESGGGALATQGQLRVRRLKVSHRGFEWWMKPSYLYRAANISQAEKNPSDEVSSELGDLKSATRSQRDLDATSTLRRVIDCCCVAISSINNTESMFVHSFLALL